MIMIRLNLVPEQFRKGKAGFLEGGIGSYPREVIFGILVAIIGVLLLIHALLGGAALYKMVRHEVLAVRWNSMAADKKALDTLTSETQTLQKRMMTMRPISSAQGIVWARFLNQVSDSVPKGVWLREVRYETDSLTIHGSAVSKMKNEMIIAGNFVSALKEEPVIKENFSGIDIDSIQRRENTPLEVADFSLKAKRKMTP